MSVDDFAEGTVESKSKEVCMLLAALGGVYKLWYASHFRAGREGSPVGVTSPSFHGVTVRNIWAGTDGREVQIHRLPAKHH